MNNLLLTKERIKRAERLRKAKLAATQNGMLISYGHLLLKTGKYKLVKKLRQRILNQESNC